MQDITSIKTDTVSSTCAQKILYCLMVAFWIYGALTFFWMHTSFGAPHPCLYSSDEYDVISRAVKMTQGDLLPIHASKPTAYNLTVAVAFGIDFITQHITHGTTVSQYERLFFIDPFHFTHIARFICINAAYATILLLVWGLRRRGIFAQIITLFLLGFFCHKTAQYRLWAKEDAFAAFWVSLSFIAAVEAWHFLTQQNLVRRKIKTYLVISAAAAGIALSTKYNCLPVVIFPAVIGHKLARLDPCTRANFITAALLTALPIIIGFVVGTPYAIIHPIEFVRQTLASPVAHQAGGGFLYVHNIGKTDLAFVGQIFISEYTLPAAILLLAATIIFIIRKTKPEAPFILWGTYTIIYIAMLCLSKQLDYQYILILSPVIVFVTAGAFDRSLNKIVCLLLILAVASLYGKDLHRTQQFDKQEKSLAESFDSMVKPENKNKPMLIFSPFFFRYWPWIHLDAPTYERLAAAAKADGREGGWFDRAAHWAPTDPERQFAADFLEIKTGFTTDKDGTRHFEQQPFSLNLSDYSGKYSLFIIPQQTIDIVDRDLPELKQFNDFIREALALPEPPNTSGIVSRIRYAN